MVEIVALTPRAINEMVTTAFPGSRGRCVEVSERHAVAVLPTDDDDIRPGGFVAGPTQFAVADSALWFLVFGALGRVEPMALTSELSIRFLRPAIGTQLHARADLATISRRSVVGTVSVWTDATGQADRRRPGHVRASARVVIVDEPDDERLADFVDLADPAARRRRERDELFIVEGLVAVARLLESRHRVRSILVTPKHRRRVEALIGPSDTMVIADEELVARTVGFHFHRGVVASAQRRPLPSAAEVLRRSARVAVLEGLNDPENLGLIARSARAFGIDALLLDPTCIDPYYRRTVRVSMGEVLLLDVARFDDWPADIDLVHGAGFTTWAMTPAVDATSIWELAVPERIAVMLGAEGSGLTAATLKAASTRVRIPISGTSTRSTSATPRRSPLRRSVDRLPVETMGLEPTTPTLQR